MTEQEFEDYKSKYLDIYEKVKGHTEKEKDSILDDVDFELELVHRDEVNVTYILNLLKQLVKVDAGVFDKKRKQISDVLSGDINLRSKRELIEEFIDSNLLHLESSDDIEEVFETYWDKKKTNAFDSMCEEENLDRDKIQAIIEEHLFSNQVPAMNDKVENALLKKKTF